jgi:hypothetical protein
MRRARSPRAAAFLAALSLLTGCSAIENLLGDDEEAPPPTVQPPPVETAPDPPPADPPPNTNDQNGTNDQQTGGFPFPGLDGLSLPLPMPDESQDPVAPARGSLGAPPSGSFDQNGHLARPYLEAEAMRIQQALVAALAAHENEQTRDIPFEIIQEDREPNAAAGCVRSTNRPAMMITSAMLELAAGISETKAYDELAGTTTYETYVTSVIEQVRNERPVTGPDLSLHSAPNNTDAHKLARQAHLYAQQIAFIVGHELAHHYRGHTNCVSGRSDAEIQRDELGRMLASTVPTFSQPREIEADMWGVTNVLEAGRNRPGGTWTQEGGLINLDFFRRLADQGGPNLAMAFLSTHPPAMVRMPIVRSTAQRWTPGWRPPAMPVPGQSGLPGGLQLPGGLRLPDPGQLPIDPNNLPIPLPRPQP